MINNVNLLDRIIQSCEIRPSDTVLELGAGNGAITSRLMAIAKKVYICENDSTLAKESLNRASMEGYTNVELVEGEAMSSKFPQFDVCVSNLPFSLSAPILFKLIRHRPLWRSSLMIVQREFADSLIADPGERNYSRLSLNSSVFVRTERVHRINGGCFYPVPPVESSLIRLTPRNPPPTFDFDEFNQLTRTAFLEKRKTLKTVFKRPSVLKMLEHNYKEYCSFNSIPTSVQPFPQYLLGVIESIGLADVPSKYVSPERMEALLDSLHRAGIYFANIGLKGTEAVMDIQNDDVHEFIPEESYQTSEPQHPDEQLEIPVVS
jgi:18S rRNA (adenine1779-N6/adenine1780-N6)-dimethyltransferase